MQRYKDWRISRKLIIAFLVISLMSAIVGTVGIINILNISQSDTMLYKENALGLSYSGMVSADYEALRYYTIKMSYADAQEDKLKYSTEMTKLVSNINSTMVLCKEVISSDEFTAISANIESSWTDYQVYIEQAIQLTNEGQPVGDDLLKSAAAVGNVLEKDLSTLRDMHADNAKDRSDSNRTAANLAIIIMVVVIVFSIAASLYLGLLNARLIGKPINKMAEVADRLALGDVYVEVVSETKDEIGKLAQSFIMLIESTREQAEAVGKVAEGDMTTDVTVRSDFDLLGRKLAELVYEMNELLTSITAAADQVAAGAKNVSDSSMVLSQGATEQASSIEELTASLEEISTQTKENANNADNANELAQRSMTNAIEGNAQMKDMLTAMEDISQSSASINKIIKVIEDIAFQTNILALNAAVEAARAGDAGRGFAVVADEVKNLASKSATAAKETTELIETSIRKVEGGTRIAKETAAALIKIVDDIEKASTLVSQIAVASNEQAIHLEQINQGIVQVAQVVQLNSATSEESAAASEELSSQADMLNDLIGKFKLKKTQNTY